VRNDTKELRRLKSLLRTRRLSWSERVAIEAKIRDLENPDIEAFRVSLPGVFGVFDRPEPGTSDSDSQPSETKEAGKSLVEKQSQPAAQDPTPPARSPAGLDALADLITDVADRIIRLRRFWATTLAPEVDRESERWLTKLHELAKGLPREIVDLILEDRAYLMHQQPRDVSKPAISQDIQQSLIAPSAPSIDMTGTWSEVYFGIHQPQRPRAPQHPPGYVPDGLQQFL
jgi:hypothetical protein